MAKAMDWLKANYDRAVVMAAAVFLFISAVAIWWSAIQFGNRLIDMPALQQRTAAIGTHIDVVRIYFKSLCINPGGFLKVAFVIPEVAEFSQGLKVLWISFDGILQLAHQCWICLLRGRRSSRIELRYRLRDLDRVRGDVFVHGEETHAKSEDEKRR